MRSIWLTFGLFCLVILTFGQANAVLEVKAISPEATGDAITLAAADSFHVDIWMKVGDGDPDLTGGSMAFGFYSPDGSISNISHLTVSTADGTLSSTKSVEMLNGFYPSLFFASIPLENSWDGSLPDTMTYAFAGLSGMTSSHPDQAYIRFNFRAGNDGIFCVEDVHAGGDIDWLFDRPYTFTPQCWTIGDYSPDFPPEITCPADAEVECGGPYDPSVTGTATATDDNDTPVITFSDSSPVPGSCPTIMTITRTWTATDSKDQSSSCDQLITIVDNTAPVFTTCPGDVTVECDTDIDPSITGQAFASDECDDTPEVTYTDSQVDDVITRTWTATDACDNSATCIQTITIDDTTPPSLTCPADIEVDNETGTCGATVNFTIDPASDNCDASVDIVADPASGTVFGLGTTLVTVTATDDAGNQAACTFNVTVNDVEAPTITFCPEDIILNCGDSNHPDNTGYATATDLCDDALDIIWSDSEPIDNVITRTWTATDDYGNTATCEQLITLAVDDEPPVFVEACPADVAVECDQIPEAATMTATDNCGDVTVTYTEVRTDGNCDYSYTLVRTWTAEDNSGN
ncbi:MAG: hypothetical protein DRP51_09065, partial [Candidatus Zixiibacteriota bacterium]